MATQGLILVKRNNRGVTNMFIFQPLLVPVICILKWLAACFLALSNLMYSTYSLLLGWSIKINDSTESDIWPRE